VKAHNTDNSVIFARRLFTKHLANMSCRYYSDRPIIITFIMMIVVFIGNQRPLPMRKSFISTPSLFSRRLVSAQTTVTTKVINVVAYDKGNQGADVRESQLNDDHLAQTAIQSESLVNDEEAQNGGKSKREQSLRSLSKNSSRRDHVTPVRSDVTSYRNNGPLRQDDDVTVLQAEEDLPLVTFNSLVQVKVSAYITWPTYVEPLICDVTERKEADETSYRFRYGASDEPVEKFAMQNVAVNFVLLEKLAINLRYRYQIQYVMRNGTRTEWTRWSASGVFDTYNTGH